MDELERLLNIKKCIYVPVSTERVFENYWLPVIEKLDLKWVRCFPCGIEMGKDELEPVKMELTELKNGLSELQHRKRGYKVIYWLKVDLILPQSYSDWNCKESCYWHNIGCFQRCRMLVNHIKNQLSL